LGVTAHPTAEWIAQQLTVAGATAATPTQVALAWLMVRPGITAPIASASKPEQVGDLVKATTLKLSSGQIAVLERASARDG